MKTGPLAQSNEEPFFLSNKVSTPIQGVAVRGKPHTPLLLQDLQACPFLCSWAMRKAVDRQVPSWWAVSAMSPRFW